MERWTSWTKEGICNFFEKELHAYQKMELPCGLATPGTDRRSACDRVFGGNLTGKTVLDIGSAQGYFCFAALGRHYTGLWVRSTRLWETAQCERFREGSSLVPRRWGHSGWLVAGVCWQRVQRVFSK